MAIFCPLVEERERERERERVRDRETGNYSSWYQINGRPQKQASIIIPQVMLMLWINSRGYLNM